MKKTTILRICYWRLLTVASFLLAAAFPKWTFRDWIIPLIIVLCGMGAGYVDRMLDEEKNKLNY